MALTLAAGHATPDTSSLDPKTGTSSSGISRHLTTRLTDMQLLDSMHQSSQQAFTQGTGGQVCRSFHGRLDDHVLHDSISSRIILALLSTGEAYIVDLRTTHRGRFELCDEDEGDERARYVASLHILSTIPNGSCRSSWFSI